jgi:putative sterol carrier protein
MEGHMTTPADQIAQMETNLRANPDRVAGMNGIFQFDLSGENGGVWHVTLANGEGSVGEGPAENPGVTISMASEDFVALTEGRLDGTMAFMSGKLKVKGDMGLAMKLQTLLR